MNLTQLVVDAARFAFRGMPIGARSQCRPQGNTDVSVVKRPSNCHYRHGRPYTTRYLTFC